MSSKVVKKGLDFVVSTDETRKKQKDKKNSRKKRQSNSPYKKRSKKDKVKMQDVDFTEQNLQYFIKSIWKMKGDTYDKIVKKQEKTMKMDKVSEEKQDEED